MINEQEILHGKVKFYNKNEGKGFIACGDDRFDFNITDVKGEDVPEAGDSCEFSVDASSSDVNKNRIAKNIKILASVSNTEESHNSRKSSDPRVRCPKCGKLIVPRIYFYKGAPEKSFCPYCGALITKFTNIPKIIGLVLFGTIALAILFWVMATNSRPY